jgi:hypothetical protein
MLRYYSPILCFLPIKSNKSKNPKSKRCSQKQIKSLRFRISGPVRAK